MLNIVEVLKHIEEVSAELRITSMEEDDATVTLHFVLIRDNRGMPITAVSGCRTFHKYNRPELFVDAADLIYCLWCSPVLYEGQEDRRRGPFEEPQSPELVPDMEVA